MRLACLLGLLGLAACAQSGAAWQQLAGTYTAELPAASSPSRRLSLELMADGHAVLVQDFHKGEPQRQAGRWEPGEGKRVKLYLLAPDKGQALKDGEGGRLEVRDSLVFEADAKGLRSVEWDRKLWGSAGLDLIREKP